MTHIYPGLVHLANWLFNAMCIAFILWWFVRCVLLVVVLFRIRRTGVDVQCEEALYNKSNFFIVLTGLALVSGGHLTSMDGFILVGGLLMMLGAYSLRKKLRLKLVEQFLTARIHPDFTKII